MGDHPGLPGPKGDPKEIAGIDTAGKEILGPDLVGLRDRAIIAAMVYTFARVGAMVAMTVEDYYTQG